MNPAWSYVLSIVGASGFLLAGRKVWWAWYVNIACQGIWVAYALASDQPGFLIGVAIYLTVFIPNAIAWTRDRPAPPPVPLRQRISGKLWVWTHPRKSAAIRRHLDDQIRTELAAALVAEASSQLLYGDGSAPAGDGPRGLVVCSCSVDPTCPIHSGSVQ